MEYICGPEHDKRSINFELPNYGFKIEDPQARSLFLRLNKLKGTRKIGVLISGGLDSALMYYLMLKENQKMDNFWEITPYSIMRKEGSKTHALPVINYVRSLFNLPNTELKLVGDNTLPEVEQVHSGQKDVLLLNDFAYIGIIESRPEHSIGWARPVFKETSRLRFPFLHLQKSHIVDLICQNNLQELFELTHSCAIHETDPCGYCNGCMERQWGLDQMNVTDYK